MALQPIWMYRARHHPSLIAFSISKQSFVLVELVSFTFELLRGSEVKLAAN
jgi:hypothetical protein